jgi:hypothetical protein
MAYCSSVCALSSTVRGKRYQVTYLLKNYYDYDKLQWRLHFRCLVQIVTQKNGFQELNCLTLPSWGMWYKGQESSILDTGETCSSQVSIYTKPQGVTCLQYLKTHVRFNSTYCPPTHSASDPEDSSLHLRRHDPENVWADSVWSITSGVHRFSRNLGPTSKL